MCLNCGCGQPNDDQGKPQNITAVDLHRAAVANGQTMRESAQHILETVELVQSGTGGNQGLARPAGAAGAGEAARGTPATES